MNGASGMSGPDPDLAPMFDVRYGRGGRPYWLEVHRDDGRAQVMRWATGGPEPVTPAGTSARTSVYGYGGGAWAPAGNGAVWSDGSDGRVYLTTGAGTTTRALTAPDPLRRTHFAEFTAAPTGEILAVREWRDGTDVERALVEIPLAGPGLARPRVRYRTTDFLSSPKVCPDGRYVAFLTWRQPFMPWDRTQLHVLDRASSTAALRTVPSGGESFFQPEWTSDGRLLVMSDRSGWWNLYDAGDLTHPLWKVDEECGVPAWQLGMRTYAVVDDGQVVVRHGRHRYALSLFDLNRGVGRRLTSGREHVTSSLAATTSAVSYVLADRAGCATLVEHDLGTGERREVRHGGTAPACAPPHRECDLVETDEGHRVPVYLYRRTGSAPRAWILDLHGGPTEQARYSLEPSLARLVDAGIGVVAVDYVGSSGHGRDYRSALYGRWGTAEVANCLAVAEWLIGTHGADPRRICVRGGSAGGWTALRALARSDRMCGAIVWSPVVDVAAMVHSPHDFEAAYMGRLFGEPGARTVREGDLEWAQHISAPVLLIHGADDTIVPVRQTLRLAEVLRARGALFECVVIEGEGHLIRRESSLRCIEEAEDRFVSKVFG